MNDSREQLTPEEQRRQAKQAVDALASITRRRFGRLARGGVIAGVFRGFFRSLIPRPRFLKRKLMVLAIGLVVVVLSIATCSAGVNLQTLTADYGEPVPATKQAALQFIERTVAAVQNASNNRMRITIPESEATSALSLGLMMPELMRAMETVPRERVLAATDIEDLRRIIRAHEDSARTTRTFRERVAAIVDPRLRTGDVQVQFTGAGEIVVAGYVQAWRWQQPALVVFAPRARSGELELTFVRGQVGRLPAPSGAFNLLGRLVASLILQGRDYAEISNLSVQEGRLTFEGRVSTPR